MSYPDTIRLAKSGVLPRFFVAKLQALDIPVGDELGFYVVPVEFAMVFRQFPSSLWDMLLEKMLSTRHVADAVASQILAGVPPAEARDNLVHMLGDPVLTNELASFLETRRERAKLVR